MMNLVGAPRRAEIDEYAIKFLIGLIAFLLPAIELALTRGGITSISQSFWVHPDFWLTQGLWTRNVFVGLLFAIAGLLLTYNGKNEDEMWLTKLASLAALLIAMFPCGCDPAGAHEILPHVHVAAAAAMFLVLAIFCAIFRHRAYAKGHREARWRGRIYTACGIGMLVSLALFIPGIVADPRRILWAETIGLLSFSFSWLTASHVLPGLNDAAERKYLFRDKRTPQSAHGRGIARLT